jgi:hypothetical protein
MAADAVSQVPDTVLSERERSTECDLAPRGRRAPHYSAPSYNALRSRRGRIMRQASGMGADGQPFLKERWSRWGEMRRLNGGRGLPILRWSAPATCIFHGEKESRIPYRRARKRRWIRHRIRVLSQARRWVHARGGIACGSNSAARHPLMTPTSHPHTPLMAVDSLMMRWINSFPSSVIARRRETK